MITYALQYRTSRSPASAFLGGLGFPRVTAVELGAPATVLVPVTMELVPATVVVFPATIVLVPATVVVPAKVVVPLASTATLFVVGQSQGFCPSGISAGLHTRVLGHLISPAIVMKPVKSAEQPVIPPA